MQKKAYNQEIEYYRRNLRIIDYTNKYEHYESQQIRVTKQLRRLKEISDDGSLVWKKNIRFEEGDNINEYDVVIFNYPIYKQYLLSRDKLNIVEKRLKNEKNYLSFLKKKLNKNKY